MNLQKQTIIARSSSFLQQLLYLGNIIIHCFFLGFSFNSLPCIPLCSVPHVENTRAASVYWSNCGLLIQSIQYKLGLICSTFWQGLSLFSMLLEFFLQTQENRIMKIPSIRVLIIGCRRTESVEFIWRWGSKHMKNFVKCNTWKNHTLNHNYIRSGNLISEFRCF